MLEPAAAAIDVKACLAELDRVGYARVGAVLAEEARQALAARVDDLMLGRVTYEGLFFQRDSDTGRYEDLQIKLGYVGPHLDYRKIEKVEKDPLFRAWIENALFERICRARMEGPIVIYRAVVMTKARAGGTALPWHQDGGSFWGLDRDPDLQIWTALDDAPEDGGCLEVLPGSHKDGLASRLGGVIPEERTRAADAEARRVLLPARAGEVILLHNYLWHRSGVSRTGHPRRALTVSYMPASTRCMRKKRTPRVFVPVFRER